MFDKFVCQEIGWYVYVLSDPATKLVFYVGKGKDNRVFQHAASALDAPDEETDKLDEIRRILAESGHVDSFIVRHRIATKKQAYVVEASVMDAMRLAGHPITNVMGGHGSRDCGLAHTSVIASIYSAPKAPEIDVAALLIRIPQLWTPQMRPDALLEATSGWWRVGENRVRAKYAFAVSAGVVRQVYRIDSWRQRRKGDRDWKHDIGKKPRWGFAGAPASELRAYLNKSVAHRFKKGQANPISYVNCGQR